ncbi:hypothetical protein H2203_001622 [Taxawa tesnikishii (nom. ined.)]|nr:hypothetical protein H2203_001622 [Dothideales sp. JES 119]
MLPPPEDLPALANVDPEIDAILKSGRLPKPTIDFSNTNVAVKQLRAFYEQWSDSPPVPGVSESIASYSAEDGTDLHLYVFAPVDTSDNALPVVVFFHGGGGAIGTPQSTAALCRSLVLDHHCVVVAPQYRLAPEHRFPTGVNDAWVAVRHIASHASSLAPAADPSLGFILGGHSHGAVLSSVLALRARDEQLSPAISGLYLGAGAFVSPTLVPNQYKPWYQSRNQEACLTAPILDRQTKAMFDSAMAPDYSSPLYRAMTWPAGHAGMPKAYFQVCGMDILRDESFIYEDVLRKEGAETRLDVYQGCPHVFWSVFFMTGQGKRWKEDTRKGMEWLLGKEN